MVAVSFSSLLETPDSVGVRPEQSLPPRIHSHLAVTLFRQRPEKTTSTLSVARRPEYNFASSKTTVPNARYREMQLYV